MAEVVQAEVTKAKGLAESLKSLGCVVRGPRSEAIGLVRKNEGVIAQGGAALQSKIDGVGALVFEDGQRARVDSNASSRVRLGVLLRKAAFDFDDRRVKRHCAASCVQVSPAESAHLATSGAGGGSHA